MKIHPSLILSFALLLPPALYIGFRAPKDAPSRVPTSQYDLGHSDAIKVKNDRLMNWVDRKSHDLSGWLSRRGEAGGPPDYIDFYIPDHMVKLNPSVAEAKVAAATKELYDEYFPPHDPSSYVGTFFESGHPYIQTKRGPYQWNSMEAAGMEDPKLFKEAVATLVKNGIKSFRLGPNLHQVEIGNAQSWQPFIEKLEVIWRYGGTPTVSIAFFPSLKKWEIKNSDGSIDYNQSYLLNPAWPKDMGRLTEDMMGLIWKKASALEGELGRKVNVVINGVNEPETLAGFNRHFWHGAHANWSSPEKLRFYIPSVIHIGEANVEMRLAVEKSAGERRVLFMHNEAMTPEYYPSHTGGGRFAVSKFMLGDRIITEGDFEQLLNEPLGDLQQRLMGKAKLDEVEWAFKEYVFGSWNNSSQKQEQARLDLVSRFQRLKNLHRKLLAATGKTMKTDNMLHLDYYYQTEFIPNKNLDDLTTELSANHGQRLKEIIGVERDEAFVAIVKNAAAGSAGDLPPEGPKGAVLDLSSYRTRQEIPFAQLLQLKDRVLLERLIGLRREYDMNDEEPYRSRQIIIGLRPLESQLYRTDHLLDLAATNNGELLKKALGTRLPELVMTKILKAAKKTGTEFSAEELSVFMRKEVLSPDADKNIRHVLEKNGHAVFNDLFGLKREFLIGFEPQHYARQIKAGIRYGFYTIFLDYVKELRVYAAGVGESGTPFYIFAPLLHDQVMMEYAMALKNGIYGTQYSFGPAVDTRGWAKGPLSFHYQDDHAVNPSGILQIKDGNLKLRGHENGQWMPQFVNPFFDSIRNQ